MFFKKKKEKESNKLLVGKYIKCIKICTHNSNVFMTGENFRLMHFNNDSFIIKSEDKNYTCVLPVTFNRYFKNTEL